MRQQHQHTYQHTHTVKTTFVDILLGDDVISSYWCVKKAATGKREQASRAGHRDNARMDGHTVYFILFYFFLSGARFLEIKIVGAFCQYARSIRVVVATQMRACNRKYIYYA